MSCIRINLIDFNETVSGEVHGGIGNALIASLSAEPETIGELESGLARFIKPIHDHSLLRWLRPRQSFVPYDAGLIIIDLTARMVMIDSTYSAPEKISECADDVSDQQTSITEPEDFLAGEQTDQPVARPARSATTTDFPD